LVLSRNVTFSRTEHEGNTSTAACRRIGVEVFNPLQFYLAILKIRRQVIAWLGVAVKEEFEAVEGVGVAQQLGAK
jgi:hypothetical protein